MSIINKETLDFSYSSKYVLYRTRFRRGYLSSDKGTLYVFTSTVDSKTLWHVDVRHVLNI